jgi:ubiquinone/menaquinone biosynthesis C-methylase UbiE
VDEQQIRDNNLRMWEDVAPGWESRREWLWELTGAVGRAMVEAASPAPGETVLELAAGTGDTGFLAARAVGDDGHLITTDISPAMVEAAKRAGEAQGVANAEYRILDMEAMDLPDDTADVVLCRWGFMFPADRPRAFAETRRVLRDGGRLAIATWGPPDRNMWAAVPGMTLVARGHMPPPEPGAPGIFALADRDLLRELVTGAGFGEPQIGEVEFAYRFKDADDFWAFIIELAGPLARVIESLDDDERAATRAAVEEGIEQFRADDGGYDISAVCLVTSAS